MILDSIFYHKEWDKRLNHLMDTERISIRNGFLCTFSNTEIEVWIKDGQPYAPHEKIFPSWKTKRRLRTMTKRALSDDIEHKRKNNMKILLGEEKSSRGNYSIFHIE